MVPIQTDDIWLPSCYVTIFLHRAFWTLHDFEPFQSIRSILRKAQTHVPSGNGSRRSANTRQRARVRASEGRRLSATSWVSIEVRRIVDWWTNTRNTRTWNKTKTCVRLQGSNKNTSICNQLSKNVQISASTAYYVWSIGVFPPYLACYIYTRVYSRACPFPPLNAFSLQHSGLGYSTGE